MSKPDKLLGLALLFRILIAGLFSTCQCWIGPVSAGPASDQQEQHRRYTPRPRHIGLHGSLDPSQALGVYPGA